MFKDLVKVKFKAGHGGKGRVAFGRSHLPEGGTGGNGGNVYLEGDSNRYDLGSFSLDVLYEAEDGEQGGVKNLTGKTGKDLIVKVPLNTNIYSETKETYTISQHGQRILLLNGGIGGLGNYYFRRGGTRTEEKFQPGKPGESLSATLELELQSDIIFIGLPNAGKSSILNALTNANSEVAAYPFTTLIPHLGRMGKVTLMDLPGLIERTAEGKGLGTNFVRHTRSAKMVAHFVSAESADPLADYQLIRNELSAIDAALGAKPEIIILSKIDLINPDEVQRKMGLFEKMKLPVYSVSTYDLDGLKRLGEVFTSSVAKYA